MTLQRPIRAATASATPGSVHVIEPGVFRANSFESARVDHAAAFVVPWCMRVFKLAKSASGTSFAVIAALSAAFS